MKQLLKSISIVAMVLLLSACNNNDDVPDNNATDNQLAQITIDVLDITETAIDVSIYGGDEDGVEHVDTYLIDAYRLSLFEEDGETVYVMDIDTQIFDSSKDSSFDFQVNFDKVYPNKQYIIRSVAYTVNGMTVTEEKVSMNQYVRTDGSAVVIPPIVAPPPPPPAIDTNIAPIAVTSQDRAVGLGQRVALSGFLSTDSDGTIVAYTWYDEAGTLLNNSISFMHTINTVGTHTIKLIVEDNDGATSSDTVVITVS